MGCGRLVWASTRRWAASGDSLFLRQKHKKGWWEQVDRVPCATWAWPSEHSQRASDRNSRLFFVFCFFIGLFTFKLKKKYEKSYELKNVNEIKKIRKLKNVQD